MYHWNFVFQSNFGLIDDATVDNRQKRHYPNAIHGKRVNLGKPDAVGGTDKGVHVSGLKKVGPKLHLLFRPESLAFRSTSGAPHNSRLQTLGPYS
jgi:hypothetical protein